MPGQYLIAVAITGIDYLLCELLRSISADIGRYFTRKLVSVSPIIPCLMGTYYIEIQNVSVTKLFFGIGRALAMTQLYNRAGEQLMLIYSTGPEFETSDLSWPQNMHYYNDLLLVKQNWVKKKDVIFVLLLLSYCSRFRFHFISNSLSQI